MNQLKEAVIAAVIDSLTETSRGKKNLMRALMLKKMGEDPRMDVKTQHPRNVAVRAGNKKLAPPGQKGGDVQRDEKGNIKRGMVGPLLTKAGQMTRTSRQHRGIPPKDKKTGNIKRGGFALEKALADRSARREKAGILASVRRMNAPGYVPPLSDEEIIKRMKKSGRHMDHDDPLRW